MTTQINDMYQFLTLTPLPDDFVIAKLCINYIEIHLMGKLLLTVYTPSMPVQNWIIVDNTCSIKFNIYT